MKKLLLLATITVTAIMVAKQSLVGANITPVLILGAFTFFFILALVNPPEKRNFSQCEKQNSLMRSLGVELPPDTELEPEGEETDRLN